ncbi:unnamed protein product [Clonostachys rosea f. rosea IK726]|jgi:hypothetical protein|uniref:Uncharacterized protein n=1 Tax=Clonostachys rosea f. rosea IK726 TaxID=1349383 RepID=A0ACA9TWU4_BIOOC|nr:unnamed protein product [Clonostachys rosea f. rosea IK726]
MGDLAVPESLPIEGGYRKILKHLPFKEGGEVVTFAINNRKAYYEGNVAKANTRLLGDFRGEFPEFAREAHELLKTTTSLVKTAEKCTEATAATHQRLAGAAIDASKAFEYNATIIADHVGQASHSTRFANAAIEDTAATIKDNVQAVAQTVGDVRILAGSTLSILGQGLERIIQELQAINQNLKGIKDQLAAQNTLAAAGGSGPDGFARVAYGYVRSHLRKYPEKGHMFFLYHPSNTWHWRFEELVEADPLPPSFGAISHNLDHLCLCMQAVREQLGHEDKQTVFHLLIPTWYPVTLDMPLHFPDEVLPLHILGFREGGKALVSFNLPAKQETLVLEDVDNNLDPHSQKLRAEVASTAVLLVGGGWITNGACLAVGLGLGTVTGLGPLLAIPVWFGGQITVGAPVAETTADIVNNLLTEERPRVLGTDQRLEE